MLAAEGHVALADLVVLDLGTMVTAPLAAMMLGQLGARVIKIERPDGGDPFRYTAGDDYGPNFVAYNQNKTSIQLDLTSAAGRDALLELVETADVLVENYRPGVMARLGLSDADLRERNAALVHCSITGFGADGPYSNRPAFDNIGIALSGILHLYYEEDRPQVSGPTLADNVTGMMACNGILAALHARDRSGGFQRVEVNILESAIAFIPDAFAFFWQKGVAQGPFSRAASSQCFACPCADGPSIAIHLSVQEKFWKAFVHALDADVSLGESPLYRNREGRIKNYKALSDAIAGIFRTRPRSYWLQRLSDADVPCAPIHAIPDVVCDPHVRHLETFQTAEHAVKGKVTGIHSPIKINGVRSRVVPAPALGEHQSGTAPEKNAVTKGGPRAGDL